MGARYLFGEPARYLKKGSIRREGDQVVIDVSDSATDMLIVQAGFSLEF